MTNNIYFIALSMIPGLGSIHAKNLVSYCGDAEQVFKEPKRKLLKIPGIGPGAIAKLHAPEAFIAAEIEMAFMEQHGIVCVPYTHLDYPRRLQHCTDSPLLLYTQGKANLNPTKIIAVVGTRRATKYGKDFTAQLIEELRSQELSVVSGMALGIDAQAHKSSLENKLETIGVLGHHLHTMYPSSHKSLAKEIILNNGALVSEYASTNPILPSNFPMRNRIVAGMADATIIVESANKGGALITALIANSYHRDVFALPGRYKDKYSAGCNALIKSLKANVIENAQDLIAHMGWEHQTTKPRRIQKELAIDLNPDEQKILEVLSTEESLETDTIMAKTQMNGGKLATILLELELRGIVNALPGNRYGLS